MRSTTARIPAVRSPRRRRRNYARSGVRCPELGALTFAPTVVPLEHGNEELLVRPTAAMGDDGRDVLLVGLQTADSLWRRHGCARYTRCRGSGAIPVARNVWQQVERRKTHRRRPALDHRQDHAAGQRARLCGQPLFGPVHALKLKQRLPPVLEPARLKLLVEGLGRPVVRRNSRAAGPPSRGASATRRGPPQSEGRPSPLCDGRRRGTSPVDLVRLVRLLAEFR